MINKAEISSNLRARRCNSVALTNYVIDLLEEQNGLRRLDAKAFTHAMEKKEKEIIKLNEVINKNLKNMIPKCKKCQGTGVDLNHKREDGSFASCEECEGYGSLLQISFFSTEKENVKVDKLVEHPKHYNSHPSGIECITVVQHYNFNVGSAMKYLWRQGLKDSEPSVRDLSKAIEYIKFEIDRIQGSATS